jgi:hypothetical protein
MWGWGMVLDVERHSFKTLSAFTITGAVAVLAATLALTAACSPGEAGIDNIRRALGVTPGTFYNFGADGQVVFEAHCKSMDFAPDTAYDVKNTDGKVIQPSSVIKITCGDSQFSTVGFTSVYMSDGAKPMLFANSQQYAQIKIQNHDRSIPLINFAWRNVKNNFVGTASVVQLCDQNNNPILAFAGSAVNTFATDVAKSTMFQVKDDRLGKGYVWISRGSYTRVDTALMG